VTRGPGSPCPVAVPNIRERVRATSLRLRRPRVTRLTPHLSLLDRLGGSPRVSPLGEGAWLVRQRTPAGREVEVDEVDADTWLVRRGQRRVLHQLGPDSLHADLLIDSQALHRSGYQLHLLRHLGEAHVGWLLDKLDVNVVLDVGANRGQYGQALRQSGYRGRIVSFEPVPHAADGLEKAASGDPEWLVRRCALGDADATMDIHVGEGQGRLSSLLPASEFGKEWNPRIDAHTTVPVDVRRLDGLIDEVLDGVEQPRIYLKLDTQGYDLRAFAGAGDRVADLVAMQSEVSLVPLYEGMPHFTDQLRTYEQAGFELTGMFPVVRDQKTLRVIEFDAMMVRTAG
jgi:FkbM family methyltransferase